MNKKRKGCLIAIIGAPLIGWTLLSMMFYTSEPTIEKHLDSVDWLPSSASDVSYFEREGFGWLKIYECSISEDDFLAFAKQNAWQIEEKEDVSVQFRNLLGEPALRDIDNIGKMDLILKALVFEDRKPNGGGITAVYDRELKRLFYSSSHR